MRYENLVDPDTLAAHLGDPNWVVIDCRFSLAEPALGERLYREAHIRGALFADLEKDLSGPVTPRTGRHPLPDPKALKDRLGDWGIGPDTQVVAYDDAGGSYAVRLWWLLRWLGHRAAAVLDGGLPVWSGQGRPLTREVPTPSQRSFPGTPDDDLWVSTETVEQGLGSERLLLIDARTAERFRGKTEPIDPVAGHIPGALNLPYPGNLAGTGRFLAPDTLRRRFVGKLGGTSPQDVVHMCGSGVSAIHNILAMEVAGLHGSRLYPGSWSEWIRLAHRPVAREAEGPPGTLT